MASAFFDLPFRNLSRLLLIRDGLIRRLQPEFSESFCDSVLEHDYKVFPYDKYEIKF